MPLVAACGTRSPGMDLPDGYTVPLDRSSWAVTTQVLNPELRAGEILGVQCELLGVQDGVGASALELTVRVSPVVDVVSEEDGLFSFKPGTVGDYLVFCGTLDGAVTDIVGDSFSVSAGEPVAVETQLESLSAVAGVGVAVDCQMFDAYGNEAHIDVREFQIETDPILELHQGIASHYVVHGTLVGTYPVACELNNGVVDVTPEQFTVLPGIPAQSQTTVTAHVVSPTEVVGASCEYFDAYGNALENIPVSLAVVPSLAHGASYDGLILGDMNFNAVVTGNYYVHCTTPGYTGGDESPAIVTVIPGLPYSWGVDALDQDCFWQDRDIPIDWVVYDYWGNVVPNVVVQVTSIPEDGFVTMGDGTYRLQAEADYDLTVEVMSEQHAESTIEPFTLSVRVDSTPPRIVVDSPNRASQLQSGTYADQQIWVDGTVNDSLSYVTALSINGADLGVSGTNTSEYFAEPQDSRFGLTIIHGEATDECGNRRVMAQSYLRSPQYFPAITATSTSGVADQGIMAHMNQEVIDDYDRSDVDDLATLGEIVLQNMDLNALAPPGTPFAQDSLSPSTCSWWEWTSDTGYWVGRDSNPNRHISVAGPWIGHMKAVDGGLEVNLALSDFDFPIYAWGALIVCGGIGGVGPAEIGISGWIGLDHMNVDATLDIALVNGEPDVELSQLDVTTQGLYVNLDCGILDFLCDLVTDTVVPLVEDQLVDAIEDQLRGTLSDTFEDLLSGFLLDTQFNIPEPINMSLHVASALDHSEWQGSFNDQPGYGEVALGTQLYPSSRHESIPANARGSLKRDSVLPTFSRTDYTFGVGLKDELVNQVLWALWYGGGLSFDNLVDSLGALTEGSSDDLSSVVSLGFHAELPPVFMPGRDGYELDIGLGDVWIEADIDIAGLLGGEASETGVGVLHIGAYLSTILGGSMDIDPTTNQLQLLVNEDFSVHLEVMEIDDVGYQGVMSDLLAKVLELLIPNLLGETLGAFPIPAFDLGALAGQGIVPPGTIWELTNASIERDPADGYLLLTGSLQ